MKLLTFSRRTWKEILRDPLNICFGLGFPIVILALLTAIQSNIPTSLFQLDRLAPGILVFGLSFITLFSATLISRDRTSSFLQRMYTTPLTAADYILGYTIPLLPLALAQGMVCYLVSALLGLPITGNTLLSVLFSVPVAFFFIMLGLLCGSLFTDKQVGAVCGALLTNLCAWLSGTWFDLELVGGWFRRAAYLLPFVHATELERSVLAGDLGAALPHLPWVIGYTLLTAAAAVWVFTRQMQKD